MFRASEVIELDGAGDLFIGANASRQERPSSTHSGLPSTEGVQDARLPKRPGFRYPAACIINLFAGRERPPSTPRSSSKSLGAEDEPGYDVRQMPVGAGRPRLPSRGERQPHPRAGWPPVPLLDARNRRRVSVVVRRAWPGRPEDGWHHVRLGRGRRRRLVPGAPCRSTSSSRWGFFVPNPFLLRRDWTGLDSGYGSTRTARQPRGSPLH